MIGIIFGHGIIKFTESSATSATIHNSLANQNKQILRSPTKAARKIKEQSIT